MKKVLVIGANGQIGRQVTQKIQDKDDMQVVAGVRKQEQIDDYEAKGFDTALTDVEGSIENLEKAMSQVNTVVFAVGSGGKTGADKTMMVDLDGAVKSVVAAKNANIEQFIIVSAIKSNDRSFWSNNTDSDGNSVGGYYYAAKYYADQALINSGLNYTIIRPGNLLNDEGIGKILVSEDLFAEDQSDDIEVPREDVASVIVESIGQENLYNKAFDLISGDTSISDALNAL